MGQIEAKTAPPITRITPHQEAAPPLPKSSRPEAVAPPEHPDRISVKDAVQRWLAGQDDDRLPSFEDIQTEIGQLKLRPEEEKLLRNVAALREKIEQLP